MRLVDSHVRNAQSMPTFKDDNNRMCWLRLGDVLVRIVFKTEDDEIVIITVHEENKRDKN